MWMAARFGEGAARYVTGAADQHTQGTSAARRWPLNVLMLNLHMHLAAPELYCGETATL